MTLIPGLLGWACTEMVLCVPSDTTTFGNPPQQIAPPNTGNITASPQPTPKALYIATNGNLYVTMAGPGQQGGEGGSLGPIAVTAGQFLPWAVAKVGALTTAQVYLCW